MNRSDAETPGEEESLANRISSMPLLCGENDFFIWQLVDSAFPTGGFAHSSGLEAAWQHGEVRNREELLSFVEAGLNQLGRAALPFVTTAWNEPDRLVELDELCDAFTSNHVANRASRLQGKAFASAVERVFGKSPITSSRLPISSPSPLASRPSPINPPSTARPDQPSAANGQSTPNEITQSAIRNPRSAIHSHFAPVFGASLRNLNVSRSTTCRMFVFNHLRSTFAAAVRLNIIGPMEAQILQNRLFPRANAMLARCESLTLDHLAQTAPLLDLWQGAQDRLYSRLFQS